MTSDTRIAQSSTESSFSELGEVKIKSLWSSLKKEPAYFWFFCIYIFFEYVRPQSIYPVIDFLPWAFLFFMLTTISWFLSSDKNIPKTKLTVPIVLFFLAASLSTVFADYPEWSRKYYEIQLNWLILFFLFIGIVNTKFRFFIVFLLLMLCSFKMSQHAAISWAQRGFSFARWGISGGKGWFANAADLGIQLCIFAPMAAIFYITFKERWGKYKSLFFLAFPVTAVMGVVATGERGTMLGLVAMALYSIFLAKKFFKYLIVVSLLAVVVYQLVPQKLLDRFDTIGEDETSQSRLIYWANGVEMYKDNPVFGVGYFNWVPYYMVHFPGESLRGAKQEVAHSAPVTILAELGTVGVITYYFIVFRILLVNRNIRRNDKSNSERFYANAAIGLNIGLIGFLIPSTFVSVAYYPFLWMQACLTAALENIRQKENARNSNS